jgi:hypothetical protein
VDGGERVGMVVALAVVAVRGIPRQATQRGHQVHQDLADAQLL